MGVGGTALDLRFLGFAKNSGVLMIGVLSRDPDQQHTVRL